MVNVRLAEEKDLENIARLYLQEWRARNEAAARVLHGEEIPDTARAKWYWGKYFTDEHKGILVAYDDMKFIGFVSFHHGYYPKGEFSLNAIYVAEGEQVERIQELMIRSAAKLVVQMGYHEMSIGIDGKDDALKALCASLGAEHELDQGLCYTWSEVWVWKEVNSSIALQTK